MQDLITYPRVLVRATLHELSLSLRFNNCLVIDSTVAITATDKCPIFRNAHNTNDGTQGRERVPSNSAPGESSCQRAEQRALPCVRRTDDSEADVGE
jgi:hypothetical protein